MPNLSTDTFNDIRQVLGLDRQPAGRRSLRLVVAAATVLGLIIVAAVVFIRWESRATVQFKTTEATRGDLTVNVTTTGTLEPVNQVDVGSEVSGTIRTVEVDYNDWVKVGQVLARLDTSKLEAQVLQTESLLESVQAKLAEVQAAVLESRDNLERFNRVREMSGGKVPSQKEYAAAEATLKRAVAAEATLKAQVSQTKAQLTIDQTNLAKAVIRSPIKGVVLKRSVDPGQTVAATWSERFW